MDKKEYISKRFELLRTIKDEDNLYNKSAEWRRKANSKESGDFKTQIWLTVKLQKDTELIAAQPEWSFVPLNDEWRVNRRMVKYAWDYHWLISNTDRVIAQVIASSTTYGTWFMYEWIRHIYKKIKTPSYRKEDWRVIISFKEEEKLVYSWIYCEKIPFQNVFINWTNIENITEAIIIRYISKDSYIAEKELDPSFSNISKIKTSNAQIHLVDWTSRWSNENEDFSNLVVEIEYFNSAADEHIIIANWITVKDSAIPYTHKEIPLCLYIDNPSEERIYWIWEFELTELDEKYKNELRLLLVKGVKSAIGIVFKDKLSEIEADELTYWLWEVYETSDINWIKHFAPNVPIQAIAEIENRIDNDIIAKTWVDFRSLMLSPWETATKTDWKQLSTKKRVNMNIKVNAFDFYRRLAYLRMKNIQFLHTIKDIDVPVKWWSITEDWIFIWDWSEYWLWKIKWKHTKGDFLVIPIVETMLWNTKERDRQLAIQYAQLVWNMVEQDWSRPVKAWQLAKLITNLFDYDFEQLTEQWWNSKSAKDILKEFDMQTNWTKWTPQDPNYIAPAQRSGAQWVPTLSWFSSLPKE